MLVPGMSEFTVTFKWIVNSLLYENGHELFIELFKYIVHPFCDAAPERGPQEATSSTSSSYNGTRPTMHELAPQETLSTTSAEELEEDQWDLIPVLDYLTENPSIEPAKFEQLWVGANVMYVTTELLFGSDSLSDQCCCHMRSGSVSATLESVPDKDVVIAAFLENRLGCLASGAVQNFVKFFFYGEMVRRLVPNFHPTVYKVLTPVRFCLS
jgi:hypothetical protein